jgi:anti-anti-sigma regulatory factor
VIPLPGLERLQLTRDLRGRQTLTLTGAWDEHQGDRLAAALATAVRSGAPRLDLTVDLCDVTGIDPAVLTRLMDVRVDVIRRCGRLTVRCSPGDVHRTVVDAGLAAHLNLHVVTRGRFSRRSSA